MIIYMPTMQFNLYVKSTPTISCYNNHVVLYKCLKPSYYNE